MEARCYARRQETTGMIRYYLGQVALLFLFLIVLLAAFVVNR